MLARAMRWTYMVIAWIVLVAVIVQFFLAGLGVFAGVSNFQMHRSLGYSLPLLMLLGLLAAFAARLPWKVIGLTALLPALVILQSVFIGLWQPGTNSIAALHVVNGLAIFSLAGFLALRARQYMTIPKLVAVKADAATP
ncbi:MAG TPA: DUF6220 domain-containing protein [Ktedonobacterales bacterium]|nr:DUF6220 domain-containing protein [Ktedonobacterales bacterium]